MASFPLFLLLFVSYHNIKCTIPKYMHAYTLVEHHTYMYEKS